MMRLLKNRHNRNERGQGILELALVLPFLLLIVLGVLDLGRIFFETIGLTNAAREGVRYLTLHPDNEAGAVLAAIDEANYAGITISNGQVTVDCTNLDGDDYCDSGTPATVTVTHDFDLILGWVLPSPITLTRSAVMAIP